jgi:hypothetical protein
MDDAFKCVLVFLRLCNVVQPNGVPTELICADPNLFVHFSSKIRTSKPYLTAALHLMLRRWSYFRRYLFAKSLLLFH